MAGQEQNTTKQASSVFRFMMVGMIDDVVSEMKDMGHAIEVGEGEGSVIIKLVGCKLVNGQIVEVAE